MAAKPFPTDLVASLALRIGISDGIKGGDIQRCIEHVMGHPVWTHEIGAHFALVAAKLQPLFKDLPDREELGALDKEALRARLADLSARLRAEHGETMDIEEGIEVRGADPMETAKALYPDTEVVLVIAP